MLWVRRASDLALAHTGVRCIAFDGNEQADELKLTLGDPALGGDGLLPLGMALAIKEPYYTFDHGKTGTICVDHPSDVVAFSMADPRVPHSLRSCEASQTSLQWKDAGNTFFNQKNYTRALDAYTHGLEVVTLDQGNLRLDLLRNRAEANICLGRFDSAMIDALAGISDDPAGRAKGLSAKACFRASRAAYELQQFEWAKLYLHKQLQLVPGDVDGVAMLGRVSARLEEEQSGEYDFEALLRNLSKHPRVDAASHIKQTEVKDSIVGEGRGLFATVDLEMGDLIMCEKAFCLVLEHERDKSVVASKLCARAGNMMVFNLGLWREVVNKLLRNPSLTEKFVALHGDHEGVGKTNVFADGKPVVDTFQILDIVAKNSFGCSIPSDRQANEAFGFAKSGNTAGCGDCGVWCHASYMNHSCLANSNRVFIGDLLLLRAERPIAAGEEITLAYCGVPDDMERTAKMIEPWGFQCSCALCTSEAADSAATKKRRKDTKEVSKSFCAKHVIQAADGFHLPSNTVMRRAEDIAKSIDATYDGERYTNIPKLVSSRHCLKTKRARLLTSNL